VVTPRSLDGSGVAGSARLRTRRIGFPVRRGRESSACRDSPLTKTTTSAHAPARRGFEVRSIGLWPITAAYWMGAAFLIAFALAAIVLAIFGVANRGTVLALQVTARWSFVLFWLAYAGGAVAWLCGPRLGGLARHGRELGLAFASAQLAHVGLVLWIIHIAKGPVGAMLFFWVGIFCTYLLALFSLPRLRDALVPRLWRIFRTIALEYIALAFTADFILNPLQAGGLGKFPLSYLPFALMLVSGAGLRVVAFSDRKLQRLQENLPLKVPAPPKDPQFRAISREDHLVVWPVLIFVGVIVVLLVLDDALWGFFESALALYGPLAVLLSAYVLFKSADRGIRFIGSQFK